MLREVDVGKLTTGMYVAELDRPWLDTPFPVQGFYIRSAADIQALQAFCQSVMVDPRRFDYRLAGNVTQLRVIPGVSETCKPARKRKHRHEARLRSTEYADAGSVEDELPAAKTAFVHGNQAFEQLWQELSAHRQVRIESFRSVVNPMVDSVLRNKDALVTLMRVQNLDRHTHEHCLALAVWGSLLGRQLGLPPEQIKILALGCSLLDIGKIRVPQEVLHKPGRLDDGELAAVQAHVDHSLAMVRDMGEAGDQVLSIVRSHHERMDGSGYPDGLSGDAIPIFARMAGIVDSYDAMISPRVYADTLSSHQALVELQDLSPARFQSELVDQFVQAIGLFPNGCLVELSNGEVGVVFAQNAGRRLRPKVMLILDEQKRKRDNLVIVDLRAHSHRDMRISRELATHEYGIDAREYFL
jgi:HD-GYP domain-containing protein (c-di-GMP phosphodiesterase class II)